ncbi:hypothetical protein MBM_04856 [Drepanopeziza brunnea f. sp. 'multigermtubi' MB_m1]|uniref:Uncharacterized protein n=1 Tax=Marssonina brunnea f. sp. multigermtubi (strain MB_m1) TaxID=1072389 RepID=K1XWZ4_MARBU|nr:uncharacterized protein MBM_04856 [Drepanopeziza brunnea f. sp. 'multigermtubi' MB_m1]EKD17279.1 hypothetical protein MBM_04856 [Drepanopeziza brunnea f. sp. 'multigermtubi' MB_m1]
MPRNCNRYTKEQEKKHPYLPRGNKVNHTSEDRKRWVSSIFPSSPLSGARFSPPKPNSEPNPTTDSRKQRFSPPPKPKPEPDFTMASNSQEVAIAKGMLAATQDEDNMRLAQQLFNENLIFESQRLKEKLIFERNNTKETYAEVSRIVKEDIMAASKAFTDNIYLFMIFGTICLIILFLTFLVICPVLLARYLQTHDVEAPRNTPFWSGFWTGAWPLAGCDKG